MGQIKFADIKNLEDLLVGHRPDHPISGANQARGLAHQSGFRALSWEQTVPVVNWRPTVVGKSYTLGVVKVRNGRSRSISNPIHGVRENSASVAFDSGR